MEPVQIKTANLCSEVAVTGSGGYTNVRMIVALSWLALYKRK